MSKLLSRGLHASNVLRTYSNVKLTLFSKKDCGLCDSAKNVLNSLTQSPDYKSVECSIVDVKLPENKRWWDMYCFDVPVLHIEDKRDHTKLHKVFHRLNENQVKDLINEIKKEI
ncbi:HBR292Wp [Eremothecium sinecaudum]|uniref:Glutaredoxin-like protein n=1 Tax=Eremothecium sinecaudum TaxID=45286 RepID=A0A109UXC1_9SACH|nr:HBR292Wp [Eremothecium sinecaudum]AMD19193.1 HBR292Wp [Eremothecium sinecaudum]